MIECFLKPIWYLRVLFSVPWRMLAHIVPLVFHPAPGPFADCVAEAPPEGSFELRIGVNPFGGASQVFGAVVFPKGFHLVPDGCAIALALPPSRAYSLVFARALITIATWRVGAQVLVWAANVGIVGLGSWVFHRNAGVIPLHRMRCRFRIRRT